MFKRNQDCSSICSEIEQKDVNSEMKYFNPDPIHLPTLDPNHSPTSFQILDPNQAERNQPKRETKTGDKARIKLNRRIFRGW